MLKPDYAAEKEPISVNVQTLVCRGYIRLLYLDKLNFLVFLQFLLYFH